MNKRWYDLEPTLSMAISLLQNAPTEHRRQATVFINERFREQYPDALKKAQAAEAYGMFAFLQKRRSMEQDAWHMVERLWYLPLEERTQLALEMIRFIYCLEYEEAKCADDITTTFAPKLEAAL